MVTVHTLVKNEENFLWYSVISVIKFVDKVLIWDTGSSDNTVRIAKELAKVFPDKISFKEVGEVDEENYSGVRQEMLEETRGGWIMILDGDEIWYDKSMLKVRNKILKNGDKYESIVVPTVNMVGDMYHFQEASAGRYKFGKRRGHFALRFVNTEIAGLHVSEVYGKEGFFDENNKPIQNRDEEKVKFISTAPYIHTTHLKRSCQDNTVMQRTKKRKYEIGLEVERDFYYPESFFESRPEFVPNVWKRMDFGFRLRSYFETPVKKIKRGLM